MNTSSNSQTETRDYDSGLLCLGATVTIFSRGGIGSKDCELVGSVADMTNKTVTVLIRRRSDGLHDQKWIFARSSGRQWGKAKAEAFDSYGQIVKIHVQATDDAPSSADADTEGAAKAWLDDTASQPGDSATYLQRDDGTLMPVGAFVADDEPQSDQRQLPEGCHRFQRPDGTIVVVKRATAGVNVGWYGGVTEDMFWTGYDLAVRDGRDPVSKGGLWSGCRYYFGDDIALLGEQVVEPNWPAAIDVDATDQELDAADDNADCEYCEGEGLLDAEKAAAIQGATHGSSEDCRQCDAADEEALCCPECSACDVEGTKAKGRCQLCGFAWLTPIPKGQTHCEVCKTKLLDNGDCAFCDHDGCYDHDRGVCDDLDCWCHKHTQAPEDEDDDQPAACGCSASVTCAQHRADQSDDPRIPRLSDGRFACDVHVVSDEGRTFVGAAACDDFATVLEIAANDSRSVCGVIVIRIWDGEQLILTQKVEDEPQDDPKVKFLDGDDSAAVDGPVATPATSDTPADVGALLDELAAAQQQCNAHFERFRGQDHNVPYAERSQEYQDSWGEAHSRREAAFNAIKAFALKRSGASVC